MFEVDSVVYMHAVTAFVQTNLLFNNQHNSPLGATFHHQRLSVECGRRALSRVIGLRRRDAGSRAREDSVHKS